MDIKDNFQAIYAIQLYICVALILLWLDHIIDTVFNHYMAASSIIFIILGCIVAAVQHKKVSNNK